MTHKENKMKKLLLGLLAVVGLCGISHAVSMWDQVNNKSNFVRFRMAFTTAVASTSTVLIDLSDTTNWPPKDPTNSANGYITIDGIRLTMDKLGSSTATVKVGVATYVDYSSGTVTWFYSHEDLVNTSSGTPVDSITNYGLYPLRCIVYPSTTQSAGKTPYILSNDQILQADTNVTVYKSSNTFLPSPAPSGFTTPGIGDIVMDIYKSVAGAVTVGIEIFYHTERK